jgi:two-component sensor histidine kinase
VPEGPAVHISQPLIVGTVHAGWVVTVWPTGYFYSKPVGGELSDTALVDRRGTLFAPTSPGSVPVGIDLAAVHDRGGEIFPGASADGRRMLYAAVPLAGGGLTALAARPATRAATYFTARTLAWSLALPLLMWGISLFVAVLSTNRLATGPLRRLTKMTRAMSHGVRDLSGIRLTGAPAELQSLSDRFMEMSRRVTRYETSLEEALEEKTGLLREVHHRVRNNLQLLVSVLNMQERTADSGAVREALARFRQRVLGLSAAHEHLVKAEKLSHPLSGQLVSDVVASALTAAGLEPLAAQIEVDAVALPQESAVPLALFVAEALAEALAADGDEPSPRLVVTLSAGPPGRARLAVERAGRGGAVAPDLAGDELGPRLMRALAGQLGGQVTCSDADGGYRVELEFAVDLGATA